MEVESSLDRVLLCSPSCPRTHYIDQDGLPITKSLLFLEIDVHHYCD